MTSVTFLTAAKQAVKDNKVHNTIILLVSIFDQLQTTKRGRTLFMDILLVRRRHCRSVANQQVLQLEFQDDSKMLLT
jgi:hypothetical protein